MEFYYFYFTVFLAEGVLFDRRAKELSWMHVSFQKETGKLFQNFHALLIQGVKLYGDGMLVVFSLIFDKFFVLVLHLLVWISFALFSFALFGFILSLLLLFFFLLLLNGLFIIRIGNVIIFIFLFLRHCRNPKVFHYENEFVENDGIVKFRFG